MLVFRITLKSAQIDPCRTQKNQSKPTTTTYLRNSQFGGGLINADTVSAGEFKLGKTLRDFAFTLRSSAFKNITILYKSVLSYLNLAQENHWLILSAFALPTV